MSKRLEVRGIETCLDCPYLYNDGREDAWCTFISEMIQGYDEVLDEDTFEIHADCPLEDDDGEKGKDS